MSRQHRECQQLVCAMAALARSFRRSVKPRASLSAAASRFISYIVQPTAEEGTAVDMIKYAKSLKNDEPSYSEAVRILQQGLSYYSADGKPSKDMASGRLQLFLATIYANMSQFDSAADCLEQVLDTKSSPLVIKGAALEALTSLCLQVHQDKEAMEYADKFKKLWEKERAHPLASENSQDTKCQALALKRLAELADPQCSTDLDLELPSLDSLKNVSGAAVLALAEFSHVQGSFPLAKSLYERAIMLSKEELELSISSLSAISMAPEAVHIGAMTGLGQLLAVMGDFEEAESQLTQALKETEKVKGEKHPQVGIVLACIGNLYQQRGVAQGSSEMLITEGMYKSALDLMKAPALDTVKDRAGRYMEIVALTRARLGSTLAPALYRRSEVEKLKDWVEGTWSSKRPFPELLHLQMLLSRDDTPKQTEDAVKNIGEASVVDVRLERVFYK